MYRKLGSFLILLSIVGIACKNDKNENKLLESTENNAAAKEIPEVEVDTLSINSTKITAQLQGKWREIDYPYRTAEFLNTTVKFVEEGTANQPAFEKFELGRECRFSSNNIKDPQSATLLLILPENSRCEQLKISNDTLILSGYSTNTKTDYAIVYLKSK